MRGPTFGRQVFMAKTGVPNTDETGRFRQLYDTYLERVYDYVMAFSKSAYIAEEVTQELFLILWRKRGDLHDVQYMDQYVFRIARNLAVNLLKRASEDEKLAAALYKQTQTKYDGVTEIIGQKGVQELIDKAVMQLPPQPRKVYLLSRREQMNYDEISEELGLSRNTVKNHLQKALSDIREYLIAHGYQPAVAVLMVKVLL